MKTFRLNNTLAVTLVALLGLQLTACNDGDELDTNQYGKSGVNILGFGPMPVTRGETMRLTGTNFDKVKEVLFPEGNQKLTASTTYINAEFERNGSEEMVVTIPDRSVPGKLTLVTNSNDTIVSASNITFQEAIDVESFGPEPVHPGNLLSIKGEYVWNIAEVIFGGSVKVEASEFHLNTRNEIQVEVPLEAATGSLVITDGGKYSEELADTFLVDTPEADSLAEPNVEFGQLVTVTGENFDLVSEVSFPSIPDPVSFNVSDDGKQISFVVPEKTVSGNIMLKSYASRSTSVAFNVPLATFETVSPDKNLKPGTSVTITGTNLDRVTMVILPGSDTLAVNEYTQSATAITFTVPEGMISGNVTLIQHENYSIQTSSIKMVVTGSEIPLWAGEAVVDDWTNQPYLLSDAGVELAEAGAKAGHTVVFYFKATDPAWKLQIIEGHWGETYASICSVGNDTEDGKFTEYDLDANGGKYELVLTQEMLDAALTQKWWGGVFLGNGDNVVITQISLIGDPAETPLWEGEAAVDDWTNQPYLLSDAGAELVEAGAKVGQTVNFYFTPTDVAWKLQIVEGHWGATYLSICSIGNDTEDGKFTEYDLEENGGKCSLILTEEILNAALEQKWWGGVFLGNGDNVMITKITLSN